MIKSYSVVSCLFTCLRSALYVQCVCQYQGLGSIQKGIDQFSSAPILVWEQELELKDFEQKKLERDLELKDF